MAVGFRKRYRENVVLQRSAKLVADTIIVLCAAYMIILLTCQRAHIIGNSMNDVLVNNQTVLVNKLPYAISNPKRYDVIAFEAAGVNSSRIYVKRVIGLPGETVLIKDGKIFINENELTDDVVKMDILTAGLAKDPITLGVDEYFVLGDNRNNSEDSRFSNIGMVSKKEIVGKAWLVISPLKNMKIIK